MALSVFEIMHGFSAFLKEYCLSNKLIRFHRCQLVNLARNQNGQYIAEVRIHGTQGILSSLPIYYSLDQLLSDEDMLAEFSQADVRTMTLYLALDHLNQVQHKPTRYRIDSQALHQGKTIYLICDSSSKRYLRKTALELFNDDALLKNFDVADIKNIVLSAVQENIFFEMGCLNEKQ